MAKSDIPFVPSSVERLRTMMELANVNFGMRVVDLGSGDGRVVMAMAIRGARATGFEVSRERVAISKKNIKKMGLEENAEIFEKSFWDVDLSEYDVVTVYGITSIMERLEQKLKMELKPGARVISNFFTFPGWAPKTIKNDVYLYVVEG